MDRALRLQQFGHDAPELMMPPVHDRWYLIEYLMELGPAVSSGFGLAITSWQEIQAWEHMTGHQLTNWEATTLRTLSSRYVAQYSKSSDPMCPPPYANHEPSPELVDQKVRSIFASLKKRKRAA